MYALSVQQPWAAKIVHGGKRCENRTWYPSPKLLKPGDWFAIHASIARMPYKDCGFTCPGDDVYKAIIGIAQFEIALSIGDLWDLECVYLREGVADFAEGPVCWCLHRVIALPTPIKCSGAFGLWRVKARAGLEAEYVLRQLIPSKE